MKRRQWSSEQKLKIVLKSLSGQIEISKLCNKYQSSQVLYYRWKGQFFRYGYQVFESKNTTKREQRLPDENQHIRKLIGELTIALKKASSTDAKKSLPKSDKEMNCS